MPRNYANAVIYKLARRDGQGECYVGSTCDIRTRRTNHKTRCTNPNAKEHHFPVYEHIRANGGWDEWECVPIESYPCENKIDLEIRERHWVDTLKPALNAQLPAAAALAGGFAEYKAEYRAEYYAANREALLVQKAEYYEANRETCRERQNEYYAANRETILAKQAERVRCDCGDEVRRNWMPRHRRSNKHQRLMASQALSPEANLGEA